MTQRKRPRLFTWGAVRTNQEGNNALLDALSNLLYRGLRHGARGYCGVSPVFIACWQFLKIRWYGAIISAARSRIWLGIGRQCSCLACSTQAASTAQIGRSSKSLIQVVALSAFSLSPLVGIIINTSSERVRRTSSRSAKASVIAKEQNFAAVVVWLSISRHWNRLSELTHSRGPASK